MVAGGAGRALDAPGLFRQHPNVSAPLRRPPGTPGVVQQIVNDLRSQGSLPVRRTKSQGPPRGINTDRTMNGTEPMPSHIVHGGRNAITGNGAGAVLR